METIRNLLKIKSIVTLSLTATFVWLSFNGQINEQTFMSVFTMVIGFYFGTQKIDEEGNDEDEF